MTDDQQKRINELCSQTWHLEPLRSAALLAIRGDRPMSQLSDAEGTRVINYLTGLVVADRELARGVKLPTAFQLEALGWLVRHSGRTKQGDGPWERSWAHASSAGQSRACRALAKRGLIEMEDRRPSSKLPPVFRWRAEVFPDDGGV